MNEDSKVCCFCGADIPVEHVVTLQISPPPGGTEVFQTIWCDKVCLREQFPKTIPWIPALDP